MTLGFILITTACQTSKHFGLILGDSLSFDQHFKSITCKNSKTLELLRKLQNILFDQNLCENYKIYYLIRICAAPWQTLNYYHWHGLSQSILTTGHKISTFPAGNNMFKVKNRNTRTRREICLKLTTKTPKRRHWCRSGIFIVNFEHISHFVLVFLLLGLSR